jgi:Glycosyl hydrolases family 2, TIM barrel domain
MDAVETGLDELRAAFAEGVSRRSTALLLKRRDEGLEWEGVTRAVALGIAARYGATTPEPAPPQSGQWWRLRLIGGAVLLYVALRPVLGLGHELVVALLAWLFHALVGTGVWEPIIRWLGLDPIYAGAAIRAAGGVQVAGFAVAAPLGNALHAALPGLFLAPDRLADGAGISMVASAGAPALGRGLAAFGADVVWLAFGLWLFWRWRHRTWRLAALGLFVQAQIAINHLFDAQLSTADVDASGLPFALEVAMPNGGWFTTGLNAIAFQVREALVGGSLVVLGYASAVALVLVGMAFARVLSFPRRRHVIRSSAPAIKPRLAVLGAALAMLTAWSPIGALAIGQSNWQLSTGPLLTTRAAPHSSGRTHTLRLAGPTPVQVQPTSNGGWQYLVDGAPEVIRGVGYNPQYAALPPRDRAALYERDFADMHRLGINTIEGWFEGQFDSVTLDAADRNGIGVVMPFELNQDWPYENPNVQQSILDHISAYIEQYKNHPAVRMWSPGNENMHRILYAHWVSQENNPTARARADAFAAFLPVLVDRIHALDPDHPVLYRDAEDVYLGRIANAFAQPGVERPWLIYGANVYSAARLQQVIGQWPNQWPGHPLVISEFAPGGLGPAERPLGFEQQWTVIRSRPGAVLGGLAYTWATNGPEDLDRVFGLVDQNGVPTDGALAALSAAYLSDPSTADAGSGSG